MEPKIVDENYSWYLNKYDEKEKKVIKTWGNTGILAAEPRFIADPNSDDEEAGIIMTMGYDWKKETTSLFVIDPKSFETLQEYKFPSRLSIQFHNNWWSHDTLKDVAKA